MFDLLAGLLIDHLFDRSFDDILTLSADSRWMWREIEWFFTMGWVVSWADSVVLWLREACTLVEGRLKDPDVFLLTDFSKVQWNLSLHVGDEDGVLES